MSNRHDNLNKQLDELLADHSVNLTASHLISAESFKPLYLSLLSNLLQIQKEQQEEEL